MSYSETINTMNKIGRNLKHLEKKLSRVDIRKLTFTDCERYLSLCEYQRQATELHTAHMKNRLQ